MPRRRLALIDGSALLHRAFYAVRAGDVVGAFHEMLVKIFDSVDPTHVVVAMDGRRSRAYRQAVYPEYKANRSTPPPELAEARQMVERYLMTEALLPVAERTDAEGDDVIAAFVRWGVAEGYECVVVSPDKDLFQLIGPDVQQFRYPHASPRLMGVQDVNEVFGCWPDQVGHVLALWGDSQDNIPGVKGVGEKGAKKIIRLAGDLETALKHPELVPKTYQAKLVQGADDARLSKQLVALRDDFEESIEPQFAVRRVSLQSKKERRAA